MEGFKELIKNNLMHRNIKPTNCLINKGVHKISDFGLATETDLEGRI